MQKQVKTDELNDDLKKRCFSVLNSVLCEYGIPFQYFYLGGFIDGYVCLEYIDENWIVYEGSRGEKIHLKEFKSFYEAGCSLFDSIVIEKEKQEEMNVVFKARLEGMLLRNSIYSPKVISLFASKHDVKKDSHQLKGLNTGDIVHLKLKDGAYVDLDVARKRPSISAIKQRQWIDGAEVDFDNPHIPFKKATFISASALNKSVQQRIAVKVLRKVYSIAAEERKPIILGERSTAKIKGVPITAVGAKITGERSTARIKGVPITAGGAKITGELKILNEKGEVILVVSND